MRRRNSFKLKPKRGNYVGRCLKTGKLQYASEAEAHLDAKRLRKMAGAKVRPYICPHCSLPGDLPAWHNGHDRPPHRRKQLVDKPLA